MKALKWRRVLFLVVFLAASIIIYLLYLHYDFVSVNSFNSIPPLPPLLTNVSSVTISSALLLQPKQPEPRVALSGPGGKPLLVLFSARYDSSLGSVVIVGYFNNRLSSSPPRVHCCLLLTSSKSALVIQQQQWQLADDYAMHEGHSMPYDGVLYFCPAKEFINKHSGASSVKFDYPNYYQVQIAADGASSSRSKGNSLTLPVQLVDVSGFSSGVAACITALRYVAQEETQMQFTMRLVEFIEVNHLLGVEHFFFYNMSLPMHASRVLKHYIGLGWASLTPWSLAAGVDTEDIHYHGQMLIMNDCLYSARDKYRLVAFIDIDEFIVPVGPQQKAITLGNAATIHALQDMGGYCALGFRNGVFPPQQQQPLAPGAAANAALASKEAGGLSADIAGCKIANLLRRQRIKAVLPFTERSKLLVVARQIKEIGIHFVWKSWHDCRTKQLDPSTGGLLHHMRQWSAGDMLEDTSIDPFRAGIIAAIGDARKRIKNLFGVDICL